MEIDRVPDLENGPAFVRVAGFRLGEVSASRVTGWIDLGPEHHQVFGIVHGGVYTSAVETAASVGGNATVRDRGQVVVGVHNSTHFLRPMREGRLDVVATPIQQGRTQQLWNVDLTDDSGRLVATGQVRLQNVEAPSDAARG